jgi:hypothetical protein
MHFVVVCLLLTFQRPLLVIFAINVPFINNDHFQLEIFNLLEIKVLKKIQIKEFCSFWTLLL